MLFKRRSKEYIKENYTHKGLMLGIIPVWLRLAIVDVDDESFGIIDDRDFASEFPAIEERNWIPKPFFYIASAIYGAWIYSALSVHWEPAAPILVYAEV